MPGHALGYRKRKPVHKRPLSPARIQRAIDDGYSGFFPGQNRKPATGFCGTLAQFLVYFLFFLFWAGFFGFWAWFIIVYIDFFADLKEVWRLNEERLKG